MTEETKISIVIPVYNAEQYVERCLKSVCGQTYTNIEVVVVDDGSTDKSGDLCDQIAKRDPRVRVYHTKNGGPSAARNTALNHISGEYLTFVDADDYISEQFLEIMYQACVEEQAEISICEYIRVTTDHYEFQTDKKKNTCISGREAVKLQFTACAEKMIVSWGKLYKREFWENLSYPEGRVNEDISTSYQVQYAAQRVAMVDQVLYAYVQSEHSIMREEFSIKRLDVLYAYKERYDYFITRDSRLADMSLRSYYNRLVRAYCLVKRKLPELQETRKKLDTEIRNYFTQTYQIRGYEDMSQKKMILVKMKLWMGRYCRILYDYLFVKKDNFV